MNQDVGQNLSHDVSSGTRQPHDPVGPSAPITAMPVPEAPLDLGGRQRFHVIGAGGPGMNALAVVLAEMGHHVSGSDRNDLPTLARLRDLGVQVLIGHDASLVADADAATYSTAIPASNIERVAAEARGVAVHRSGMLASICAAATAIGVAGAHGKTTTSSLLTLILDRAGWNPSFVIGGDVANYGTGARWTGSKWLVVESDESDKTHLSLPLHGTIVLNIEADFLENYGSLDGIVESFAQYLAQTPGPKVLCADDPYCRSLAGRLGPHDGMSVTYGQADDAVYRCCNIAPGTNGTITFDIFRRGVWSAGVELPLKGAHNAVNATAAFAMAVELGVAPNVAAEALAHFEGVGRRFERRGTAFGAELVDDYAHLPTEIAAVLRAARTGNEGWARVVAVFQPNRFTRMSVLSPDYKDAFVDADIAVLTEIYPSGDAPIPGVTAKLVVDAVLDSHPAARVAWMPQRSDLVQYLANTLRPGDLCVSMGCGDISELPDELHTAESERREGVN